MVKITLSLIIEGEKICFGEGVTAEDLNQISFVEKRGKMPESHGQLDVLEIYQELVKLRKSKEYKGREYKINIIVED